MSHHYPAPCFLLPESQAICPSAATSGLPFNLETAGSTQLSFTSASQHNPSFFRRVCSCVCARSLAASRPQNQYYWCSSAALYVLSGDLYPGGSSLAASPTTFMSSRSRTPKPVPGAKVPSAQLSKLRRSAGRGLPQQPAADPSLQAETQKLSLVSFETRTVLTHVDMRGLEDSWQGAASVWISITKNKACRRCKFTLSSRARNEVEVKLL